MQKHRYLHSFGFVVIFMAAMFFLSPSRAQAQDDTRTPIATFFYFGEKITLYRSMAPNFYLDQNREMWIPMEGDNKTGQGRYQYKKMSLATSQEVDTVKKLAGSSMPGIYYDHRGEQWLKTKDPQSKETIYIRLGEASQDDMKKVPNANSLTWMWWRQAKEFPAQDLKFSVAQFIVEMTACYGTNVLTFTKASNSSPACTTEFFRHILDPKALAGFYMFMVASGYTSETTMRIIELSHKLRGTGVSNEVLRRKFMPYLGYFGMVAGSLASSLTENILSNKYWPACIAMIKTEGLANEYCRKVIFSFATDQEFWRHFGTSVPSLLLASVAAHFTQQVVVGGYRRWTSSQALKLMNVTVLSASDAVLQQVARFGPKAVLGVRFVGGMVAGVPGVIVFVVTEVGHFVGFLKYQEWFEFPITRAINDLIETNKAYEGMEKVVAGVQASQKIGWKTAVTTEIDCKYKRISGVRTRVCDQEETIPVGLSLLNTGAKNFRKMVLANRFEEANSKWATKVSGFMNKYRTGKLIMQHVYAHREEQPKKTSMSLPATAKQLVMLWSNAVQIEVPPERERILSMLERDLNNISNLATGFDSPLNSAPAKAAQGLLTVFLPAPIMPLAGVLLPKPTSEEKLRNVMLEFQNKVGWYTSNLFDSGIGFNFCMAAPRVCSVLNVTLNIDFSKLPTTQEKGIEDSLLETRDFIHNLSGMYGVDVLRDTFGNMLCNDLSDEFSGNHIDDDGRAAVFNMPMMLKLNDTQRDAYFRNNCSDGNGNRKFWLDIADFSRPWIVGDRVFSDPISLLMDKDMQLTLGANEDEASSSWQTRAFPIGSTFLKNMTAMYQKMLADEFYPEVPQMTADDLMQRTRPHMRGATLDYSIVTIGQSKLTIPFTNIPIPLSLGERPLLSESLLGHVTFILHQIKYYGPEFPGKYELCDRILAKYAEHIVGLNNQISINPLVSEWDKYENDIKFAGTSQDQIDEANREFAARIGEVAFSKARIEKADGESKEIYGLIDELYKQLAQFDPTELTGMDTETYMFGMPLEEASKLSTEEYKKYIFYQLEYDTLTNILVEIDENYDKLRLKVFSTLPDETH